MKCLFAFAILAFSASIVAQDVSSKDQDTTKGRTLYTQCSNWHVKNATTAQIDEANQCVSYIDGFIDGYDPSLKYGCLIGVSFPEMIDAYLEYMEKNPQYLQMSKRFGLEAALSHKFCWHRKEPSKNK